MAATVDTSKFDGEFRKHRNFQYLIIMNVKIIWPILIFDSAETSSWREI